MTPENKRFETCSVCARVWHVSRKMDPADYGGAYICPGCRQRLRDNDKKLRQPRSGKEKEK